MAPMLDVAIHCLQCTMSLFARCRHSLSATACLLCRLRCLTVAVEGAASSSLEHTPPPPPPPTALEPGTVRGIGFSRLKRGGSIREADPVTYSPTLVKANLSPPPSPLDPGPSTPSIDPGIHEFLLCTPSIPLLCARDDCANT